MNPIAQKKREHLPGHLPLRLFLFFFLSSILLFSCEAFQRPPPTSSNMLQSRNSMQRRVASVLLFRRTSIVGKRTISMASTTKEDCDAASMSKIAVIGAGISGSVAANALAKKGFRVEVFEGGRGPGGRAATRRPRGEGARFAFDHGAQYVGRPKDPRFAALLAEAAAAGAAAAWAGRVGTLTAAPGRAPGAAAAAAGPPAFVPDPEAKGPRYVGVPGMDALCRHLLAPPSGGGLLSARYGARVAAAAPEGGGAGGGGGGRGWRLRGGAGGQEELGRFDFLVVTDRTLAAGVAHPEVILAGRPGGQKEELSEAGIEEFSALVGDLEPSTPSATLLLGYDRPLAELPFDGAVVGPSAGGGGLGWVCRDSSKPGRGGGGGGERPSESWVVQAGPELSREILEAGLAEDPSLPREAVYDRIAAALLPRWEALVAPFFGNGGGGEGLPSPAYVKGHRWAAAFPGVYGAADSLGRCFVDEERHFAACGDFLSGPKVEGAALSGLEAADRVEEVLLRRRNDVKISTQHDKEKGTAKL